MKKKLFALFVVLLLVLTVSSCGKNKEPETQQHQQEQGSNEETCTVTFSGTSMAQQNFAKGGKLNKPSEPTKTDHIFGGWYTDSSYVNEATFPMTIDNDTTIYAKFYSYQDAFEMAREKTIGSGVANFEFAYTVDASVNYSALALTGHTDGNAKYDADGDVSFYDVSVNSGALFYDGTKYQIKKANTLQKISLDENDVLRKYKTEEVDSSYKYDSSSFAKAVFEYSSEQLKSIKKTSKANEYELVTSLNASQAMSLIGNYVNSPIVESVLGTLPATNVKTGMYVTFSNGELKTYRYEMHIDIATIKFDLVYNLIFKNVGVQQVITPKVVAGIAISNDDIKNYKAEILSKVNSYEEQEHSSYDVVLKTGVNYPSKNEINSTFDCSTKRKVEGSNVYFYNLIEIDSDYKNADLYKAADLEDIKIVKTKLSDGSVYNIEKRAILADRDYLVESYVDNYNDKFYMLSILDCLTELSFIQKITKDSKVTYSIGISSSNVTSLLEWVNNNVDLDPLDRSSADVKIYGSLDKSKVEVKDSEVTFILEDGKLSSIEIIAKGSYNSKLEGSRDFTEYQDASFELKFNLTFTTDGNTFEPYESIGKVK